MNQSGNVISGGPVDAGVAGGLPMEPRTTDVEAWRAEIEAKRAKNAAARARLERALASQQAAAVVPRPAPRPAPATEPDEPAEEIPADVTPTVAVTVEPDPVTVEPDPVTVEPDPVTVEPEPVTVEPPEPVDATEPPAPATDPTPAAKPRPRPAQPRSPHARGPRQIPVAVIADAVRSYLAGTPLDELARQHKVGHERMRALLVDAGVQIRPKTTRGNHRPKVDTKAIAADYVAGKSAPQIAAERGHSAATVRRALRTEGVPQRDDRAGRPRHGARTTFTPEQVAEMAVAYGHGESLRTIATRFQVNDARVRNALAAAGVTIRPPANVRDRDTVVLAPPPAPDPAPAAADEEYVTVVIDGTEGFTTQDDIAAAADIGDVEAPYVAAIREAETSGRLLTGLDLDSSCGPAFPLFSPATEHHLTPTLTALADHLEAVVGLVREINTALNRRPL